MKIRLGMHQWVIDTSKAVMEWFRERAHGRHAQAWLFIVAFTESSFFLIPADFLLMAILLAGAQSWWYYALLTTAGSVLGGIFGYFIGAWFYDTIGVHIISFYELGTEVQYIGELFSDTAFWTVLFAAFTPVPYKAFVLAGGFFKINLPIFIVASVLGRAIRFFAIAYLTHKYRPQIVSLFFRYFSIATYIVIGLLLVWLLTTL